MTDIEPELIGFQILVETDTYLTVGEVWPDGDAPENPTAADVLAAIRNVSATDRVRSEELSDWGLLDDIEVTVIDGAGRSASSSDPKP